MSIIDKFIYRLMGYSYIKELNEGDKIIDILEREGEKKILVNGATYSVIKDEIYTHSYWDYFLPLIGMRERPDVLMIGLGAGTIAYQSNALFPNASMDVVEIDKEMVKIAKEFDPEMNANIVIDDGARFVASSKKKYDLIILDAYSGIKIPLVFMKEPFISDAERALKQGGILAINYARSVSERAELDRYITMLKMHFNVYIVNAKPTTENVIIICTKNISKDKLLEKISSCMKWDSSNTFLLDSYSKIA